MSAFDLESLNAIAPSCETLGGIASDPTPPDPARLIQALRQIGYSLEQAISDLIDNSINARATRVLIRFICDAESIRSIVVADDGLGMDVSTLREAMRFGSRHESAPNSLGKYGMGLKLASLSHAKCLTVVTRGVAGIALGRRWTIRSIEQGWKCEAIGEADASLQLAAPWGAIDLQRHGTLVIWDAIDKLPVGSKGIRETLRAFQKRLQLHLGLCFHRFLENNRLMIFIDQQTADQAEQLIRCDVKALNPFGYARSGDATYPKTFRFHLSGVGELQGQAHIWPPNSDEVEYKLGNKAAARQGFYFYRNDRLIQAGGWNGVVQHETEPHSSLARVQIDLPAALDSECGLNVQKSAVLMPPGFDRAVLAGRSDDGDTFESYRKRAQQVYRRRDARAERALPLVPGEGFPRRLAERSQDVLADASSRVRDVGFAWSDLGNADVFAMNRDARAILINRVYRKQLLKGSRATKTDVPFFKMLLFFLLEEDFDSDRMSARRKERLEQINSLLGEALSHQRD